MQFLQHHQRLGCHPQVNTCNSHTEQRHVGADGNVGGVSPSVARPLRKFGRQLCDAPLPNPVIVLRCRTPVIVYTRTGTHYLTGSGNGRAIVATGTVKWFNPTKGYGFVQPQSGGKDVFVHISAVERAGLSTLKEGAVIEYEVVANNGKESAENIKVR